MPSSKNSPEPIPGMTANNKSRKRAGAGGPKAANTSVRKSSDGPPVPPAARQAARAKAAAADRPKESGNPRWLVPVMVGLMVLGLVWIVIYYIAQANLPVPGIGNWNLAIGFALVISGFMLTMRWR